MQLKDKISRGMVRQQYHARYPERGESYARKVTEARTGREVVTGGGRCVDRSDRVTEEVIINRWKIESLQLKEYEKKNVKEVLQELMKTTKQRK